MKGSAVVAVVAVLGLPVVARAEFEGVLEARITVGQGQATGAVRSWISSAGIRSETELSSARAQPAGMGSVQHTMIFKTAEPSRAYVIDSARKTYSVQDLESGTTGEDEKYVIRRLGRATVAGHTCESVEISTDSGRDSEMCVAEDLIASEAWFRAILAREGGRRGLFKALADAGVKGFPIRWVAKGKDGSDQFRMELVSAKRERVPASMFEIPADYTKSETMMPAMSPDMAKRMDEAMKRMSPEQRQKMEEALKQMQETK